MGKVQFTPATPSDFFEFTGELPPARVRAFTARVDGRIIGIGGIGLMPDGTRVAFTNLSEEAHNYPIALHKAALFTLKTAREMGVKRLVATTVTNHPAAERWLLRLGFAKRVINGIGVFIRDDR